MHIRVTFTIKISLEKNRRFIFLALDIWCILLPTLNSGNSKATDTLEDLSVL